MPDGGYVHPEYLVETDWVAARLGDPKLLVLDCTTHLIPDPKITYTVKSGREDFEREAHPRRAICRYPGRCLRTIPARPSCASCCRRRQISPPRCAAASATTAGSSPTAPLTRNGPRGCGGYCESSGLTTPRCSTVGSRNGRAKAARSRLGPAKPRPAGTFSERAAKPLMADKHDVLAAIGDGAVCTINALQATQHAGVGGNSYGRPGRIKGSVNVPTVGLLDPATNTFLPPAALRAQFDAVHAFDRKVITPYCGGGCIRSQRHRRHSPSSCSVTRTSEATTPRCRNGQSTRLCRWR